MIQSQTDRDIIIRVGPGRQRRTSDGRSGTNTVRAYDAFVYTKLPLSLDLKDAPKATAGEILRGLPVRGVGTLEIKWSRYQDLLAQFFDGEKGLEAMYYRMRDTLSPPLRKLVDVVRSSEQPMRIWWVNDTPELDDMPWDLLFYGQYGDRPHFGPARASCVRGVPPAVPPPLLAVSGPLRVLWDAGPRTPWWLRQVFQDLGPDLVSVPFDGPVREALVKARAEGFEILHLSADGVVSLAYEGVLYRHGDPAPELSASEMSQLTAGSRLSLLSLTAQAVASPDMVQIGEREVASSYRAFACFSSSRVTLPSTVLPIGPTPDDGATTSFWTTFYRQLALTHDSEKALALARFEAPGSPHSLFLRHAQGKLFRTADQARGKVENPERLTMQVRSFAEVNTQAETIQQRYGELPGYLQNLLSEEKERQADVEAALEDWARPEGDRK